MMPPGAKVHALPIDAAETTTGVLQEPKPFVLQTSLDDFYVSYEINACTLQPGRMAVIYGELNQNIQDKFVRDANAATLPGSYLPAGYTTPAFRIFRPERNRGRADADNGSGAGRQPAPSI